ncbi:MAG: VWA domain-containing protein [Thiotrichales bacterium]|nr:VWA domain-containing protein [Thiotrichales bacterium]
MPELFHFIRPYWLLALPVLGILVWMGSQSDRTSSIWNRICDPWLVTVLLARKPETGQLLSKRKLLALVVVILIISLAGPSWEKSPDPLYRSSAALIIAFDLSASMLAHDVEPSRYQRARFKIDDMLTQHQAGNVALLAYAADAHVVTPLTHDVETLKVLIPALSPKIMPAQGTNLDAVLQLSKELLTRSNLQEGDLLLVTDGIGGEDVEALGEKSREHGLRISVLGIGTEAGIRVPAMNDIDFLQDQEGPVYSRLESESLLELADVTGGLYVKVRSDSEDIGRLSAFLNRAPGRQIKAHDSGPENWVDQGVWLILLCLPFAALLFRKNLLFVLALSLVLSPAEQLEAAGIEEWFMNDNQRGKIAFNRNDFSTSRQLFTDMRWKAATAYRQNDWEQALDYYRQLDDIESVYNRGNTLVFLTRFAEAIVAYNEVLKRNPDHADAAHNKKEIMNIMDKLYNNKRPGEGGPGNENNRDSEEKDSESGDTREESASREQEQSGVSQEAEQKAGITDDQPINASATRPSRSNEASTAEIGEVEHELDEKTLAEEQWLRRIKDDPAGLLRRKFRKKYLESEGRLQYSGDPW